jgi:hypothetical protein
MGMARDQPVIRRLMPDDAGEYRTLRLRALREHPDAFTSSFEEEQIRPLAWAQARLRPDAERPHDFFSGRFHRRRTRRHGGAAGPLPAQGAAQRRGGGHVRGA